MTSQPIKAGGVQLENQKADTLIDLMKALEDIDTTTPEAKQNEISISDNNGGRILL